MSVFANMNPHSPAGAIACSITLDSTNVGSENIFSPYVQLDSTEGMGSIEHHLPHPSLTHPVVPQMFLGR